MEAFLFVVLWIAGLTLLVNSVCFVAFILYRHTRAGASEERAVHGDQWRRFTLDAYYRMPAVRVLGWLTAIAFALPLVALAIYFASACLILFMVQ